MLRDSIPSNVCPCYARVPKLRLIQWYLAMLVGAYEQFAHLAKRYHVSGFTSLMFFILHSMTEREIRHAANDLHCWSQLATACRSGAWSDLVHFEAQFWETLQWHLSLFFTRDRVQIDTILHVPCHIVSLDRNTYHMFTDLVASGWFFRYSYLQRSFRRRRSPLLNQIGNLLWKQEKLVMT